MTASGRVPARWTPDCQGKQDFDGTLVCVSTRYWPRGGGFAVFSRAGGWEGNDARPGIRPSSTSRVYLGSTDNEFYDDAVELAKESFEADTESEVKAQVEAWVAEQFKRIRAAVLAAYGKEGTP